MNKKDGRTKHFGRRLPKYFHMKTVAQREKFNKTWSRTSACFALSFVLNENTRKGKVTFCSHKIQRHTKQKEQQTTQKLIVWTKF